ncbi:MAG TPA: DUF5916 domain-containing protein [Gemmatimonadaceae bacterium]|nr:DUF5916 domain-containing protein [Gemmatimonadaceae bacterium]
MRHPLRAAAAAVVLGAAAIAATPVVTVVRAQASRTGASVHPTAPLVATSARRQGQITIDGKIDEAAWAAATPITTFRQFQPTEGAPASLPTEVRILYDDQALYVAARMTDSVGAAGVRAPLARRDQLLAASGDNGSFNSLTTDKLAIVLDPYHNHLDEAWFEINPAGVRGDQLNGDDSWDPIWEGAAHVDAQGWTAEMRIPYSQLRFTRDEAQTWGLQIWRFVDRLNEQDMWSWWRRNASGGPAFYGHLQGLTIAERPRQLELLPYVVSRGQFKYAAPADPYHDKTSTRLSAGADLKYLLTSNLTLDATFNPDFGQVEVDPATVNLSAYETYYDEKRPFFVANRGAFSFGGTSCMFCSNFSGLGVFYSRRIGRPPQLNAYVADQSVNTGNGYADVPDNATILGAAKITGRTKSGYTVGLLDAVANRETARYLTAPDRPQIDQMVEPLSNYFVGRVKKELNQGATTIGTIVTSTARRLDGDTVAVNRLRSHAEAVGVDWMHRWHARDYSWRGSIVASNVAGSPAAITLVERSSAHYFQRPDRRVTGDEIFGARYDTTATSLQGYGLYTRLAKDNGDWLWETAQNWRSPGFEVNDLSYLDRADYRWMNANVGHSWSIPTRWYRNIFASVGGQQQFNYDGLRTDSQRQAYYGMELPSYWNIRTFTIHRATTDDDQLTRGGPTVKRTGYDFGHFQISTDARQSAVFDMTVQVAKGIHSGTHTTMLSPGVALKPAASVFVQLSPTYMLDQNPAQYVTTVDDPTATAFAGKRYVFAFINTRTVSLDTRVNWTMTPNLTLQMFAQPFFASGDYGLFREFAAPRTERKLEYGNDVGTICPVEGGGGRVTSYDFNPTASVSCSITDPAARKAALPYSFANPNFSFRSLRGTAVVRWEYRPGSTMFFVWTQQRSGALSNGDFDFGRDYSAMFRDRPDNVFIVKVNYWLGR